MKKTLCAALLSIGIAGSANAGFLGNTVGFVYSFPTLGNVLVSNQAVVGAGEEFSFTVRHWDFSDNQIITRFDNCGSCSFSSSAFNGASFFDVFASIDPITNVTIDAATTLPGFNASRITFDANHIDINYQSLPISANYVVVMNVEFGGQVPEPGTLALLGLGMAGLALRRRKHN